MTPEVRWVLQRAFVGESGWSPLTGTAKAALAVAQKLGLSPRIFGRVTPERLKRELADDYVHAAARHRIETAKALARERSIACIDAVAVSTNIPYTFVKGAALTRGNVVPFTYRGACDVDILVEPSRGVEFQDALVGQGFRRLSELGSMFHLPVMVDDAGGVIEVHTGFPELKFLGSCGEVTFLDLQAEKLLEPAHGLSKHAHVPVREFLVGHAIAHGIAHHGFLPLTYPLMKMLADVVDLGVAERVLGGAAVTKWPRPNVSDAELSAVFAVAACLVDGSFEDVWGGAGASSRLLRHCVLGSLDERYARGLWLHYAAYTRSRQWRALGPRRFAEEIWLRITSRTEARLRLGQREYQRQYGTAARGHDFVAFRWSSLPATFEVLKRAVQGRRSN